jgi:zinc transport system substrate-binding protein
MAAAVRDELSQIRPDDANKFQRGFDALAGDLDDLHERISRKLAPFAGREFYVFHPALGYFADAYGLVQVSVEHEGKEPTGSRLAALQDRMNRNAATTLFVEPQFTSSAANALAERVGAGIVTINPLAGDYLDNLETMADRIAAALSPQSAGRDINPAPRDVTTRRPS